MIPAIVGNLPYLIVFLIGIKLAFDRRRTHPQLALLAAIAYGVLVLLWGVRMAQIGTLISAQQQAMPVEDIQATMAVFAKIRMIVHYLVLAFLIAGVFRWRKEAGDPWKVPAILAGAAVLLIACSVMFGRDLMGHQAGRMLTLFFGLGAEILILTALFGWRSSEYAAPATGVTLKKTGAVAETPGVSVTSGIFGEEDYIPYAAGVMILGGLLLVPMLWGKLGGIGYIKAVIPSLISCAIFVYAHDKRGNFSFWKFIVGTVFVVLMMLRALAQPGADGAARPMFLAGGIVGYIIMFACGWAGIAAGRFLRGRWNS